MRDAAGQLADRLHLLRLAQALFGPVERLGLQAFGGDIATVGIDERALGRRPPRNPPHRAVGMGVAIDIVAEVAARFGLIKRLLGTRQIVGPDEFAEVTTNGIGRVIAEHRLPRWID